MKLKEGVSVDVVDALWVSGYILRISFSDGFSHPVDFEPFLSASMQPEIRAYLDVDRFKAFSISFGNLIWDDYTMCFPLADLYSGSVADFEESHRRVAESGEDYRCRPRD